MTFQQDIVMTQARVGDSGGGGMNIWFGMSHHRVVDQPFIRFGPEKCLLSG